jgi:hypothetical protein
VENINNSNKPKPDFRHRLMQRKTDSNGGEEAVPIDSKLANGRGTVKTRVIENGVEKTFNLGLYACIGGHYHNSDERLVPVSGEFLIITMDPNDPQTEKVVRLRKDGCGNFPENILLQPMMAHIIISLEKGSEIKISRNHGPITQFAKYQDIIDAYSLDSDTYIRGIKKYVDMA